MEVNFPEKVTILGADYAIKVCKKGDELAFKRHPAAYGFCETMEKRIIILDRRDEKLISEDPTAYNSFCCWMQKTLRHEIVHAFLHESGLGHNTKFTGSWASNEEMVDWIALQGPKLIKAWTDAGAL